MCAIPYFAPPLGKKMFLKGKLSRPFHDANLTMQEDEQLKALTSFENLLNI